MPPPPLLHHPCRQTPRNAQSLPLPVCRDLAGGLVSRLIDLANFQAAPISLQGLSENNLVMMQVRRAPPLPINASCFALNDPPVHRLQHL